MAQQTALSVAALPGRVHTFAAKAWSRPRIWTAIAGDVFIAGLRAGMAWLAGAKTGDVFMAGAKSGQVRR